MADRIFSIDFGSAYTKVALRRDPTADGELLACEGVEYDRWIPTVLAVDRRGAEPRVEIGDRAAGLKSGGGIDVFANFKADLFADTSGTPDRPQLSPLDALLQSEEFAALAAKYSVLPPQVAALRAMTVSARALVTAPGERTVSLQAHRQANAAKAAQHFFLWLRKRILAACAKLPATGLKYEDIPLRVAVPALDGVVDVSQHPGCKLLREALHRAGWPLHPDCPFVTEPESNAVGILTKAANVLSRRGHIHLGEMFNKGPLVTVLKGDAHHPRYRALVIDVGAFTTDFAALSVNTEGKTPELSGGAGFSVTARSARLGANDLDASLPKSLPPEKREWLEKTSRKEFSAFQRNVFWEGKGYRVPGLGVIGGDADREALQACVGEFAAQVAKEIEHFCAGLEPGGMQELILTGGGSYIPAVRDAIISAAQSGGHTYVKTHASELKRAKSGPPVDSLNEAFVRGGSALGGASIYFEKSYYP
jgi:hypothetical protein